MKRSEYLTAAAECELNESVIKRVEDKYKCRLPDIVKHIISFSQESIFFDDGYRCLSLDEIVDAEIDLHVDFLERQIIPLFDCGENDFIVYNFASLSWSKFNIVDDCTFKTRKYINELF
ncbi:MAG: hypothetical protein NC299_16195 [Lachnospiraceae bacterium]|nr:hypothetical protein [Ruminococcus sp.]MCM1276877.1 hypothetical protein [Lachnospiraceae bacterium]